MPSTVYQVTVFTYMYSISEYSCFNSNNITVQYTVDNNEVEMPLPLACWQQQQLASNKYMHA